ncbi:MAG: YhjD/YihY/BrkB family envelope integrity protein [Desulfovibrionaceae bacterium]|nr:YhjD/YihY/BrkB family envelope integrity protein [Desulfovibrionaceae bacterium]
MPSSRLKERISKAAEYFSARIWSEDSCGGRSLSCLVDSVSRFGYLVARNFLKDQCLVRAAALTFATILSIVPLVAVAFSISKGFGLQNAAFIRDLLLRLTAGRAETADTILQYIANTNVKTLGWLGVGLLLVTVFSMVGTVEKAFNTIWRVRRGRTPWRKFTDFFSVILVCPVIVVIATSVTLTLQKQDFVRQILSVSALGWLEAALLKLAPLFLVWMGFVFAYSFIPNTRVRLASAVLGGLLAGALWQTAQWAYINWQIGVHKYNAIYGSFAQLPLLLIWLYISWIIVLLGAEVCYAVQNIKSYTRQRFLGRVSARQRQKIALLALIVLARRFLHGERPGNVDEVAAAMGVPGSLVAEVLGDLGAQGLVLPVEDPEGQVFVPAVSPHKLRVTDVLLAVAANGGDEARVAAAGPFTGVEELVSGIEAAAEQSPLNASLADCAKGLARAEDGSLDFKPFEPDRS